MRSLQMLAVGLLVVGISSGLRAEEKKADTTVEKLLGSWEVVKADEGAPPVGSVVTFAKEGKMKITHKVEGKDETAEGTYTLKGEELSVTLKHGDKEETHKVTIKKLTATEMVAENEKGKKAEFKKKK